jgi:arginine/lysine/ornithine decarboxylase
MAFPQCALDVTELSYTDDLQHPTAAIAQAQRDIAAILGAKRSYILTDGSSCGVMAMLYVASKFGTKIIVPRNSHKSVFNACRILGLEPVIVQGAENEGVLLPPATDLIEKLLVNDVSIAGMLVTSPDYYGNIAPLGEYGEVLKKYNRLFLVDGAHGTHLAFEEGRPYHASRYADIWVDGAHKSMPVFTQGAVLSVNKEELFPLAEEGLSIFRTSSPSYPIMASVELGLKLIAENPKYIERAKKATEDFKQEMEGIPFYPSADWTKLALDCAPLGVDPSEVVDYLEHRNVYVEMNDGRYVLFYLSPMTEPADFSKLKPLLLAALSPKNCKKEYKPRKPYPVPDRTYSFLYALKARTEYLPLVNAIGRMCAENVGITPPCYPVIVAGEMVTQEAVELLRSSGNTFGIYEGKIKVVAKR